MKLLSCSYTDNITRIEFERPLKAHDKFDWAWPVGAAQPTTWAMGPLSDGSTIETPVVLFHQIDVSAIGLLSCLVMSRLSRDAAGSGCCRPHEHSMVCICIRCTQAMLCVMESGSDAMPKDIQVRSGCRQLQCKACMLDPASLSLCSMCDLGSDTRRAKRSTRRRTSSSTSARRRTTAPPPSQQAHQVRARASQDPNDPDGKTPKSVASRSVLAGPCPMPPVSSSPFCVFGVANHPAGRSQARCKSQHDM